MAEQRLRTHLVSCEGGLNTQLGALSLGRPEMNGMAAGLINYEPSDGYRRLEGFTQVVGISGFVGSGSVAGLEIFKDKIIAARRSNGTTYRMYEASITDNGWTTVTPADITFGTSTRVRTHNINWAGRKMVWVDGTNNAKSYTGSGVVTLNGSGVLSAPSLVTSFKSRLVLAGDPSQPYTVGLSAPNDETNWDGAAGAIAINVGDTVTQVKSFRDELVIICRNGIKRIVGSSSTNFQVQPVTSDLGSLSPDAVFEIGGDLYFWSNDGLRSYRIADNNNDTDVSTVTIPIRPSVRGLTGTYDVSNLTSVVIRSKSQFRVFLTSSTASEQSVWGFLGALNINSPITRTAEAGGEMPHWEFGLLKGINPSCTTSGYISGREYVFHGGFDGKVYQQENGNKFGTRAITSIYDTPFMDIGDPFVRKTLYKLLTYIKVSGATTIYMKTRFDFNSTDVIQPETQRITLSGISGEYDDANTQYGSALYGVSSFPFDLSNLRGSCKTVSIRIMTIDDQAAHAIHGFAMEYGMEARA